MCGIAGCIDHGRDVDPALVGSQLRTLDHRGPDSWGVFPGHQGSGAIGQTRLAIIDLVTGDPPIANEDSSVGAVLNGEIYNFQQLREDLRRAGHTLRTDGDTEVIAHLAEDLDGVSLARRLHGMFTFAVWDEDSQRLMLGRDRLGKKPLYYWTDGSRLVFGSEIKAVLADPAVPRALDPSVIPAYLTFGYVPTPRTFFDGIRSLPPGHVLTFTRDHGLRIEEYWGPQIPNTGGPMALDLSLSEAAREVRARLSAAVERRMVADVPLGAFLSGGVDSSTIVALMAEVSPKPVLTFTIGFEDTEGFDERPYARKVAERCGTEHVEFVVTPHAVDLVEKLVWHHDQPFGDSSAVPTFLLSELTRRHVTVALCGDGGDELFAGYERFTAAAMLGRYQWAFQLVGAPLRRALTALPAGNLADRAAKVRRFVERTELGLPAAFLAWVSYVPLEWRRALVGRADNWGTEDYQRIWAGSEGSDVRDRLLDVTLRTYLLDDLLPKVDRMAMANALEVRSPFLDHELVEFALRLPPTTRMCGLARKRVLKAAAADLLPREILHRRKHGFGVPLNRWFRSDLRAYVRATLGSADARVRDHVAPEALDRLLAEHEVGQANHGDALWTLLTLELFLRREGW